MLAQERFVCSAIGVASDARVVRHHSRTAMMYTRTCATATDIL